MRKLFSDSPYPPFEKNKKAGPSSCQKGPAFLYRHGESVKRLD